MNCIGLIGVVAQMHTLPTFSIIWNRFELSKDWNKSVEVDLSYASKKAILHLGHISI